MNAVKRFLHRKTIAAQLLCAVTLIPSASTADNPIVQTIYTADPAPLVHDGRLYVYTGHDEDRSTNFTMNEWRVYSTVDMVNWTDHGSPLKYNTFNWSKGDAWAGQAIHRNGKFYFYVPTKSRSLDRMSIGVAMSDSPTGPFSDPIGRPLVANSWEDIDPTAFIDDDGQAYLYWGNPNLWYVKLNEDMISYQGGVVKGPMTTASFGSRAGNRDRPTLYEEGPWLYKRNDLYYLVFAAGGIPEYLAYSTSPGPTGPWTYKGTIMPTEGGSFTNHPGVVDYKGNSYLFYHNGALQGGGGFTRSVCVEQFTYDANGTFPTIKMTSAGPPAIANLNPYLATEAETIAWESGVETEVCSEGGMDVTAIENGDYIKVKGVDFGPGAVSFDARVASASNGGNIELRLDSPSGTLVGACTVQGTGGWQKWVTRSCPVSGATGLHDLYLKFTGGGGSLLNFNWWRFDSGGADAGVADAGVADAGAADADADADAGARDAGARDASAADAAAVDGGASNAEAGTADGSESVSGCGCGWRGAPAGGNLAGLVLVSFLAALLHRRGGTGSSEQRARYPALRKYAGGWGSGRQPR